jgi:predicted nucleotidyltransferase
MAIEADICELVAKLPGVDAAIEFGSRARADPSYGDIDVLVVVRDDDVRRQVASQLDSLGERHEPPLAPSIYTWASLRSRLDAVPSFAAHLRDEGRVLAAREVDSKRLLALLRSIRVTDESLRCEFEELQKRCLRIARPARVSDAYGTALGRLFSVGRASAILRLMSEGDPIYNWRRAFTRLASHHPEYADALDTIARIRPFYEALDGRRDPDDLDWEHAKELYESSVRAVAQLTALEAEGD